MQAKEQFIGRHFGTRCFTFDERHTTYVVLQSHGFYDVPWVLIADARSYQALAAIFD